MEYILFAIYLIVVAWLVTKVKFFTRSGLSKEQLIILFLLKVMAGIFYGWIGIYYGGMAQMSDTWLYHSFGIKEYALLFDNPHDYFTNLFRDPYVNGYKQFFNTTDSYWNFLKGHIFVKVLSVFNLLSFGNYYINVIFYSFLTIAGPVAMYRVMNDVFPGRKKVILIATFMVPSFLYWTSGLHKEGLIFLGISLVVYVIYFSLKQNRINLLRIISLVAGLLLVLALRNFIIVILLPALLTWLLATCYPRRALTIFITCYAFFTLLFFSLQLINPNWDLRQVVVTKQEEFLRLPGETSLVVNKLEPTLTSFVKNIPQSISLSFLRPYPSDVRHILSLAATIEVFLYLLFFTFFLFFRANTIQSKATLYFCLFFGVSLLLSIGFSTNNIGAIVRYRSIALPFLIIPLMAQIDWIQINNRINEWFKKH